MPRPLAALALTSFILTHACLVQPATAATVTTNTDGASGHRRPVDYVEPRIDTVASRWFHFSSACRPFGMVNLSPDTETAGRSWNTGYLYDRTKVHCFSHIHGWQIAGIPVMPNVGEFKSHLGFSAAAASFSHDDEIVRPGYHKVMLGDLGVTAELTSTCRVGFHRYTFPATDQACLAFSLGETLGHGPMSDSSATRVSDTEIEGSVEMAPTGRRKKPFRVYFVARTDKPFQPGTWANGTLHPGQETLATRGGYYLRFATAPGEVVQLKVALSYVSTANARANLEAELPHWDFNQVVRESAAEWNEWLSRIRVTGGTEAQRIKFYTDLWHALLGRRIVSDADGSYADNTGPTTVARRIPLDEHGRPRYNAHNFDALWGTHWSLAILWSLAYPEVMDHFCSTMLDYYRHGGLIPRGPSGGNYTFVMIGDPAAPFFAAAWQKGIRNWDSETAYQGLRKNAFPGGIRDRAGYETGPNPAGGGMHYYIERNYIPLHSDGSGGHREGAAQTLEYAWQDWCLAQFAEALGKSDDAALFAGRAGNWRNLFHPGEGWIVPRNKDGSWMSGFTPVLAGGDFNAPGFVESNSAIYTWHIPQDLAGLAALMGGKATAADKLEQQFQQAAANRFIANHARHAWSWVDYQNQPATALGHLFNHLGRPWRTQYWIRRVNEETFGGITPYSGYNGDEDQGQLGALSALMSIGLFDVQGGADIDPDYELTSPVFDETVITLDPRYYPGGTFTIRTHGATAANPYIQRAELNGQPLNSFHFPHATFAAGGLLELWLGPEPNRQWGLE